MDSAIATYNGKPCRSTEMTIGNTLFTVISVQGDAAKETAYDKVKKADNGQRGNGAEKLSACTQQYRLNDLIIPR